MKQIAKNPRSKLKIIITITAVVLAYILLFVFFKVKLTHISEMYKSVENIYGSYGYLLIFLGALIEGTFIIGFYIPGSLIVFLGVSLARQGITSFPLVILTGLLGFCLGYTINYCLGRFGWFRVIDAIGLDKKISDTKHKLMRHYNTTIFWGYMMASTGSLVSTASGILKIPFPEFIFKTVAFELFWILILGGLAYMFGDTFINIFLVYFGTIVIISFILYLLHNLFKKRNTK